MIRAEFTSFGWARDKFVEIGGAPRGDEALGAALLLCVEPMGAKMIMPMLGAAPALWVTSNDCAVAIAVLPRDVVTGNGMSVPAHPEPVTAPESVSAVSRLAGEARARFCENAAAAAPGDVSNLLGVLVTSRRQHR